MTEPEILVALRNGEMWALEHLYNRYADKVYSYLMSLTKNGEVAGDITQSLFVHLWEKRLNVDITGGIGGYIYTIARNKAYYHFRKKLFADNYRRTLAASRRGKESEEPGVEDDIDYAIIEDMISELISRLPPARREIFMMRWYDGLSNKEIAEKLNLSEKTVSTQIHRSVVFMRETFKGSVPLLIAALTALYHH